MTNGSQPNEDSAHSDMVKRTKSNDLFLSWMFKNVIWITLALTTVYLVLAYNGVKKTEIKKQNKINIIQNIEEALYSDSEFNPRLYLNFNNWRYPEELFREANITTEKGNIVIKIHSTLKGQPSKNDFRNRQKMYGKSYGEALQDNDKTEDVTKSHENTGNNSSLSRCPLIPPNLRGKVNVTKVIKMTFEQLEQKYDHLLNGGHYMPPECLARQRVAIIIPYRNRLEHLRVFLNHMHDFLTYQQIEYRIFVIELAKERKFNKGIMLNAGFLEANRLGPFDCFIFHDVDLLPENDHSLYTCWSNSPKHLSVAIDRHQYKLLYSKLIGGVNAMTKEQFTIVNGYSNKFYGWGGEDDDLYFRITQSNMVLSRYTEEIGRYVMLFHRKQKANPQRYKVMQLGNTRWKHDGLNTLKYSVLNIEMLKLCTYILINFNSSNPMLKEDVFTTLKPPRKKRH